MWKLNLYKIILQQVLPFAFRVKVLRFDFKNFKSAFDIFKQINSEAYLGPPWYLDEPQVTWANGVQPLANVTKSSISYVVGVLDFSWICKELTSYRFIYTLMSLPT